MKEGTTLDGVGHGSLLAGRYRLEERVRTGADGSLWRAIDETLDRPVSVRVVRPSHRHTADIVDAARRAALVEDARLIRVLDVGESGGSAYIVTEYLVGRTLADLLAEGPIPAETARRLVGEAAEALDRAGARGLHHLQLTPESLVTAPDGTVKVLGTAVEAALAGMERHEDPVGANRIDAVGLVRVLYAGLTGRWPGGVEGPLGPAPRVTGRAVPPGDLVAGVPNDLDTLCAVTLGPHGDGPHSPGELAEQLAPWAAAGPLTAPRGLAVAGPHRPAPGSVEALAAQASSGRLPVVDREIIGPAADGVSDTTADEASGVRAGGPEADGDPHDERDDWALLSGTAPVVRPAESHSEPLGPFIPAAPISRPTQDQTRLVLGIVAGLVVLGLILAVFSLRGLLASADPLIQPEPLIPATPTTRSRADAPPPPPPTVASSLPAASSATSPTGSPGPSPSNTPAEISGVQTIDPLGDGDENGSTADRAIDADPSTNWRSARYESAGFGGLKQGLGLYLQLSSGPITTVSVEMGGRGGSVELRTAKGPGLDGSTVVATAGSQDGKAVLTPPAPLPGGPLLLWFTELPQQDSGEYRLVITEISIS